MIVITGAAGFIASNLARALNEAGYFDLVLVDDFSRPEKVRNWQPLKYSHKVEREQFIEWLEVNQKQVEYVFHLGARTDTTEMNWEVLEHLNINYSKKIWKLCATFGIPLLYASSAATYGDGSEGFSDELAVFEKLSPLNPYGKSKHLFDVWVLEQKEQPPQWVGLKFFNVYGYGEFHKGRMASVILHSYRQIKESGSLKLFKSHKEGWEDGMQKRDFIWVQDLVKMCQLFMFNRKVSGIFNAGTGCARTFWDLGIAVFNAMGISPSIEFIDMPDRLRNQYQYFTEAKMDVFLSHFPFNFTALEVGVSSYVSQLIAED